MEPVDQPRRIGRAALRWIERIEHRRRVAEEDVPIAAHEVNGDVSNQNEESDMRPRVLQTQEVEIRALMFRFGESHNVKGVNVEVQSLLEAFGEQPRHLSCPNHRELVIEPRRVQDKYSLQAVGVSRVRERAETARRESGCQQCLPPNATSQVQPAHVSQNSISEVILKKRGVRMVLGRGHDASGTNALL